MNTSVNFDNASQALQRYESSSSNVVRFNDIEASSDEDNIGVCFACIGSDDVM